MTDTWPYPVPPGEADRVAALRALGILDTPPEPAFDDVARLAAHICGVPIALVTLVDEHRQWFKARVGLDLAETPRNVSFCTHAIVGDDVLVVENAAEDPRFTNNPLVLQSPAIRFYAGAPLTTSDGHALGTVCVLDQAPRALTPEQREALRALSRQVSAQLELRRKAEALRASRAALEDQARFTAAVLDTVGSAVVVVGRDRRIVRVNRACEELTGYPASELVGRSVLDLLAPDEAARIEAEVPRGEPDFPRRVETVWQTRAGERRTVVSTNRPLQDASGRTTHIVVSTTDVTERRRLAAEQARVTRRLETLLRTLQAAVLIEDEQRRVVLANQAFCELFRVPVPPDALLGADCAGAAVAASALFADPAAFLAGVDGLLAARERRVGELIEMADGHVVERDYLPLFVDGSYQGHLWVYRDVSERERGRRRLRMQYDVTAALVAAQALDDVAYGVLRAIGEGLGFCLGAFWELDEDDLLVCRDSWHGAGIDGDAVRAFVAESQDVVSRSGARRGTTTILERVVRDGDPFWSDEIVEAPGFLRGDVARRLSLRSCFMVPVRGSRGPLGALEFFSIGQPRPASDVLDAAEIIGREIGLFIERRRAEERALDAHARRSAALDASLDGVVSMDHEGRITEFNQAAERAFGIRAEQAIGRMLGDVLIPPAMRHRHQAGLERYLATGVSTVLGKRLQLTARHLSGREFPVEVSIIRNPVPGPATFTGFFRDLTQQREVERLKKAFVSTVSHELRTPLTSIRGSLGLLASGAAGRLPEDAGHLIEIAERNAVRLIGLINDILDLERAESARLGLAPADHPAAALVQRAIESVAEVARAAGVRIAPVPTDLAVHVDGDRIVQVLVNLLSNAVKFSTSGSDVTVHVSERGSQREFHVVDRGRGIPADMHETIFEPFRQAESSDSRAKGGTGLGLSISRAIVEAHGGSIGVISAPGEGSTFWFRVPASAPDA